MSAKNYPFLSIKISAREGIKISLLKINNKKDSWSINQELVKIYLTKRNSYPKTFFIRKNNFLVLGYIEPKLYSDFKTYLTSEKKIIQFVKKLNQKLEQEFLLIVLKENPFEIKVYRDIFCTLPVFYMQKNGFFFLSNEFIEIFSYLSKDVQTIDIDFRCLAERLLFSGISPNKTIFSKIKILTERSVLISNRKGIKIKYPISNLISTKSLNLRNPLAEFTKILEKTLYNYWSKFKERWYVGFEISGGVDSVTSIKFYNQISRKRLKGFSMILPGKSGIGQRKKLKKIMKFFDIKIDFTHIVNLWPLKNQIKSKKLKPFYLGQEIYFEALDKMAKKAEDQGVKVIITGTGGDEAFRIDSREEIGFQGPQEKKIRESFNFPSFFTNKLRYAFSHLDENIVCPIPMVPYSVLGSNLARNNIYIRHNIWPVLPLSNHRFIKFCRRLPEKSKKNKKILRDYLKEQNYPEEIYSPEYNENFANFFENTMRRDEINKLLMRLISISQLAKLGIINQKKLIESYLKYRQEKSEISPLYFYTIITTEILLQSC